MPTNKDFKRLVRRRMQKTGEAYTAARAHLLTRAKPAPSPAPTLPAAAVPTPSDYARLAGMSDAALKAKTGCTWERWVYALDRAKADTWSHREIAEYVHKKYKVPDWWSQTVTVGYERIKGLRAIGQRRNGSFETNKSRTFGVSVARLYRSFSEPEARGHWLPGIDLTVRAAKPDKSIRITWPDASSVEVLFTRKSVAKSQVAIQHRKLPDREASLRMKEFWSNRLGTLAAILESDGGDR